MDWRAAKKRITYDLSASLSKAEFKRVGRSLEWIRYVNDVCQVVTAEKMKGDHLRVRVFVVSESGQTLGGNLSRSSIQGGGTIGADYYWSIGPETELPKEIEDIYAAIERSALPWFSTISSEATLQEAVDTYAPEMRYRLLQSYFPVASQFDIVRNVITQFWSPGDIEKLALEYLLPALQAEGFSYCRSPIFFARKRGVITDVIEVVPINYGVHFVSYAYNWVTQLSATGQPEFDPESRVILVGGVVTLPDGSSEEPLVFSLGSQGNARKSIQSLQHLLTSSVIPSLSSVTSVEDFTNAVDPIHQTILEHFGLRKV